MTAANLIVEVLWGPEQGRKAVVPPGGRVTVGRGEAATLRLADDQAMAPVHFELQWDGQAAALTSLVNEETCLDGQPVKQGHSGHGGWLRAGTTDLALAIERHTEPDPRPSPEDRAAAQPAIAALRSHPGRLFALVDASRAPRIRVLLRESPARHRQLFDGWQGDAVADVAPYLVDLGPPHPQLLEDLVIEGWNKPWAVFLAAPAGRELEAVRRHLRKFLLVDLRGEQVFFRFYDPRVLQGFVPTCTPSERAEFLGDLAWHVTCPQGLLTFRT